ncbi:FAD-dependent oxidoreductase, partial [Achromobacter xylosoxidans]|nr:FAD-dependent oxidoreductase [Achromobacter xylosoxidans]
MIGLPSRKPRKDRAGMTRGEPLRLARQEQADRLGGEHFDMLIVGGGITGAYAALDASLRGYRVALVEKDDFASGTSSKSSKMVHGGLRYIEQGNLGLVRHSLHERQR